MPARLVDVHQRIEQRLQAAARGRAAAGAAGRAAADERRGGAARACSTFLRTRTGRDFTYYKRATILRRIARRMQVNGVDDLPAYLDFLRTHPGEAGALLQDLLISVTNFFRDRDALRRARGADPGAVRGQGAERRGARLGAGLRHRRGGVLDRDAAAEHARTLDAPPALQVFATDLDEDAIRSRARRRLPGGDRRRRVARSGCAASSSSEHARLPRPPRAARDGALRRARPAEGRAVLAPRPGHLPQPADLPEPRGAAARARDRSTSRCGRDGRLFLGSSETVDDGSPLFRVRRQEAPHLRAARRCARAALPVPRGPEHAGACAARRSSARRRPVVAGAAVRAAAPIAAAVGRAPERPGAASWRELHFKLLERFAPPSVLVNAEHEIVHLSESAGRFLQLAGRRADAATCCARSHPVLRIELRAALLPRARRSSEPAEIGAGAGRARRRARASVDIRVSPAPTTSRPASCSSRSTCAAPTSAAPRRAGAARRTTTPIVRHLEQRARAS